jgi:hypothetical protein
MARSRTAASAAPAQALEKGAKAPSERWLTQTKAGGGHVPPEERGDCVPACIASILRLPIDAIGNTHGDGWWDRLQVEVAKHGYTLAILDMKLSPPPTYWIASLPSLNLPPEPDGKQPWHSVVAHGYDLVHDPSLGKRYDDALWAEAWNADKVAEGWALVPLEAREENAA